MTQAELLANPELLKDYREWKNAPIGRLAADIVRLQGAPVMPPLELLQRTEVCAALHANQAGKFWGLQRLFSLDAEPAQQDLEPDFGFNQYLKNYGVSEEETKDGNE